jgi:hypothetical protein
MQLAGSATTHVGTAAPDCPAAQVYRAAAGFGPLRTRAVQAREGHGFSRAVKARHKDAGFSP